MLRMTKATRLGAFVLALGLGSAGCSGSDTKQQPPPKGGGGGDMMGQKMKEMAEKHGGGSHADKDKDEDKDKDKEKEKEKDKKE